MSLDGEPEDFDEFPIAYSIDNAILMHRDAHFGGDFSTMIDYYNKGGKGVNQEFDLSRIEELHSTQQRTGKDLSPLMLSGAEAEKVSHSRDLYKQLRDLYEKKHVKSSIPRLIADLILAEEEETQQAVQAVVKEKGAIVPALIDLVRTEDFYDPLFPGYGQAPVLAAECLGLIGDKRAIISLFESIGTGDFFNEDVILDAIRTIGQPAKEFLLRVLHGRPLNIDNERAAIALVKFKDDHEVAQACLTMLQEIDLVKEEALATYLVLACEGLSSKKEREALLALAKHPKTPKTVRQDIMAVAKAWA